MKALLREITAAPSAKPTPCVAVKQLIEAPSMNVGLFPRILCLAAAAFLSASPLATSQSAAPPQTEEIARLKAENEKLRAENQRLRQLLVQGSPGSAPSVPVQRAAPVSSSSVTRSSTEGQGLTHWVTSSSGKRHNSSCRWYRNSNGRPATAAEGTACLKCGG